MLVAKQTAGRISRIRLNINASLAASESTPVAVLHTGASPVWLIGAFRRSVMRLSASRWRTLRASTTSTPRALLSTIEKHRPKSNTAPRVRLHPCSAVPPYPRKSHEAADAKVPNRYHPPKLKLRRPVNIDRFSQALTGPVMIPIALPMHLQVGQSREVKSSVTVPVRTLSAWKYIRTSLDTLKREAKLFSDASACFITT